MKMVIVGYKKNGDYVNVDIVKDDDYNGHVGQIAFSCGIKSSTFQDLIKGKSLPYDISDCDLEVGSSVKEGKYLSRWLQKARL